MFNDSRVQMAYRTSDVKLVAFIALDFINNVAPETKVTGFCKAILNVACCHFFGFLGKSVPQ
jgi:hypothetical protein